MAQGNSPPSASRAPSLPGQGRGGRWSVALYHNIALEDEIMIRPQIDTLDLLNGSATGNDGGTSRHELELNAGAFYNGMGFRLSGNYRSSSFVEGGDNANASDLTFHDIATFDARVFFSFDSRPVWVRSLPFLKGARLRIRMDNIFNAQQRVTDANGDVPLRYQPGFIDPQGRFIEFSLRKRF